MMFFKVPMVDGGKVDDEWEFGETNGSDGDLEEVRSFWGLLCNWVVAGSILVGAAAAVWTFVLKPIPNCTIIVSATGYRQEYVWIGQGSRECGQVWHNTNDAIWHARLSFPRQDREFTSIGKTFLYMNSHCTPQGPYRVQMRDDGSHPEVVWDFAGDKVHPRADK